MGRLAEVADIAGAARYMGGYLNMQSYGMRTYITSAGWVFPDWIGFSKWYKKEFEKYPPREMLVELAKMSKAEREEYPWFAVCLWEKKRGVEQYNERAVIDVKLSCVGESIYRL